MNQSVTYRQNAAECYEAARILSDPRQKAKLLAMAQSWISLADHADRDSHFEAATDPLPKGERRVARRPAVLRQPHTSFSLYARHYVVEFLTKCRVQYRSHGDVRFVDARRY